MNRSLVFVLLGVLAVLGALIALDVIPLGLGGGDGAADEAASDLMGVDGAGDEAGATLKGRPGTKRADDEAEHVAVDPLDAIPSEVRGTTPSGGAVRGRVVRKKGGVPVAGVLVTLSRPDSLITYLRAQANGRYDELQARTNAEGRFSFLDVTPSKGYVVRARHPEHAIATYGEDIDLTGRESLDIGDLHLGSGGTLTGRVVGPEGTPLPNVRVVIAWRITNPIGIILADPDTAPEIEREVKTGKDGRYKADKLDPTPKTIIAVTPAGASQVVRSVSLEEGELKAVDDIRMPGQGLIAGTVVWADGTPIAGARVFAAPEMQAAVRTVETNDQGVFKLAWLPEGEDYVIGTLVEGLPVNLHMGASLGDEDVRIEFPQPGRIKGRVLTADGKAPVTRFRVQLDTAMPPENWQMRFVMEQVKRGLGPRPFQDEGGLFQYPRVAAGAYRVIVSAPGFPDVTVEDVAVVAGEETEIVVEVPRGHTGKGIVRRADGSPLAGARLHVFSRLPASATGTGLSTYIEERAPDAVTRGDGTFEVPPQSPGSYAIVASHPTALPGVLRGVDLGAGDVKDLEIKLPPAGAVRGLLLDEHARPAKEETVYVLYRDGKAVTVETGEDGRYERAGLPVGRCIVSWMSLLDVKQYHQLRRAPDDDARAKVFDELSHKHGEHDLRDGATLEISLRIPSRTVVRGRYLLAGAVASKDVPRFFVTVEGGGQWTGVELKEDGSYEVKLLPGTYIVYGPTSEGDWDGVPFEVPGGATASIDIEMR